MESGKYDDPPFPEPRVIKPEISRTTDGVEAHACNEKLTINTLGPGSTARHLCHCGKSFIRKEHLTRHQSSHDKLAYLCNICQRQFSRR